MFLLPPSPRDWLPEDHLAYFISDTVEALDLSVFYRRYEGDGRRNQPFDPRMMVKVLLYGYATGVTSSRKLARRMQEDVAFRVLGAGNFPAHRTIAEFRQRHLKEFQELFAQVVRIAQEAGLVKLGMLAVDGAKVRANASKRKAMSYGRMKKEERKLRQQIQELLVRAEEEDAREDELYGPDRRGDELPEELRRREDRLRKIQEAKERLKARQAEEDRQKGRRRGDGRKSPKGGRKFKRGFGVPEEKAQENFTDPESRIMKTSTEGFQQCYNPQIAVDAGSQVIVACSVQQSAGDQKALLPLLEESRKTTGREPERLVADAGYKAEGTFRRLEKRGIEAYISLGREGKKVRKMGKGRGATRRMAQRLKTPEGREQYRRRKAIVEPVFGWIKEAMGFRRFGLRGLEKVRGEWDLVCLAINLKRLSIQMVWA
jgi:transposase